ncbi:peptide synthetase [Eremomyces bilateralis CBS 781.70]|uniref:Peptide synthetase n=1 Tax=Eremomyces bilateralis CBS 781.70 TaxID=1392243 RepID=A0A6G1G2N1_9PEZI|nr:peptide synthetase [Eremomyces bilateralis CBS 781.70]KAF1812365.1 peptide synthetase [Eremomyces bilateralis CBS 781.70]
MIQDEVMIRPTQTPCDMSSGTVSLYLSTCMDILTGLASKKFHSVTEAVRVGESELTQLWKWNGTVPETIKLCMQDIVSEIAHKSPDRPAVTSWDGDLTYGEVDTLSTQLAVRLFDLGAGPGRTIPLSFEKCKWTVVALLAVMKTGSAVVLTDPSQPEARLRTIATEVNARLVVTSQAQSKLGAAIAPNATVVVVDDQSMRPELLPAVVELPPVNPVLTMYLQFTSGSTGKPKGVIISHTNFTSGALPRAELVGYKPHSRVLDFPSYAFDVSIDCMLCTLANGGCICVPSEDARVNDLSEAIRSMRVNMAHMTPSVARVLDPDIMPSLEVLGLGGESISAKDASVWNQKTKLVIAYGPSECTVGCTINNDIGHGKSYTNIGKGVGGVTWIVDPEDHNRLVPIGAVGELLIEGPVVGQGYLREPEKTADVFIENPVWLDDGYRTAAARYGRLYKTGDLVRYDQDGTGAIVFMGRKDQQVKLRGQRIELAEVEYHIARHLPSGTKITVEVITAAGPGSEPMLAAFISEPNYSDAADPTDLLTHFSPGLGKLVEVIETKLAEDLPSYMIPTTYIPLKEMPSLVSRKTDRKKLREIGSSFSRQELSKFRVSSTETVAPQTEMEKGLQQLWMNLFDSKDQISSGENFFSVGGDSLRAMKLVAAARAERLVLTVADIFRHPILRDMARAMGRVSVDASTEESAPFSLIGPTWNIDDARLQVGKLCGLAPHQIEDIYPCTPLQEGLMALSAKVNEAYVAQRVVPLPDLAFAKRLQAAFETVVADSPIMRTRIIQVPGHGLMQAVVNESISWRSGANLQEYLQQDAEEAMDLGTPLARYGVVADPSSTNGDAAGNIQFVLTMHHALYDGWSMPLIVERINKAFNGQKIVRSASFKQFIQHLASQDNSESSHFWRDQLEGATGPQFPALPFAGYQPQADSLLEHYVPITKNVASKTTLATAIRGAWAFIAAQYTGSSDVVFGETLTGRNAAIPGVEEIEGPMITTVPVRVTVDRGASKLDYLQAIHQQTVLRIPHEHMGLQHIRRLSLDAFDACELRTGMVLHPSTEEAITQSLESEPANGFVPAGDEDAAREALKFNSYALMLVCSLDSNGFLTMASFDSCTVGKPLMEKILKEFGQVVQDLCADDRSLLGTIDVLTDVERAEIRELSGAPLLPSEKDLHSFESSGSSWIVCPTDPDALVPIGAVGELLTGRPTSHTDDALEPQWANVQSTDGANHQLRLYKTGYLAKFADNSSIVIVGKTSDLKRLRTDIQKSQGNTEWAPVTSAKQEKLRGLWSRLLGITETEIGLNDSFIDIGGDSISAMKLVSEARIAGLKLTVAQIFRFRQLKDLADVAEDTQSVKTVQETFSPFGTLQIPDVDSFVATAVRPALARNDWKIVDVLPARPLQEIAVKGTTQLPRYSARYELFHFSASVDGTKLLRSCNDLVAQNEILRTVFIEHESACYGVVVEDIEVPIVEYEIEGDVPSFAQKLCELDIQTRMPMGSPFLKFLYIKGDRNQSCLMMRISHAQYDEICLPILLQQLSALFNGTPVQEAVPFSRFVSHVVRTNIPQSLEYWRQTLQGSSMSVLRPDIPLTSKESASVHKAIDISSRPKGITIATLPTAAWALCLARRLSSRDVTFGEVASGRNLELPDCEAVMGPSWQYVPTRVKFESDWTVLDLLQSIQHQHISRTRYEGIGLKEIVKHCTDWPETVDWFDTVVHQDVEHVEQMAFGSTPCRMETIYPHLEPLREWKIQAFIKGDEMILEIVTFESWIGFAATLLEELESAMRHLLEPSSLLFS